MARNVTGKAVVAFLSALSIALRRLDREAADPEATDSHRRIEAEIRQFFLHHREHESLTDRDWEDLQELCYVFHELYDYANLVMLDPSSETPQ